MHFCNNKIDHGQKLRRYNPGKFEREAGNV